MISYRELAMRVVGRPLRVSDTKPRPAARRVTALALTAAMMAALSAPAFAGTYYIGNDGGDITIEANEDGTAKVSRGDTVLNASDSNVVIRGGKGTDDTGSADTGSQNSDDSSAPVSTLEADDSAAPVAVEEDDDGGDLTYTDPTPVVTWPDESAEETADETSDLEQTDAEEKAETDIETPADADDEEPTQPAENIPATLEVPVNEAISLPAASSREDKGGRNDVVTYEDNSPVQKVASAFTNTVSNIIKIINKVKGSDLNVTLDNVSIDASGRDSAALTIEGEGNTTLTLTGDNTLKGGAGYAGLDDLGFTGQPDEGEIPVNGKLTITGSGSLTTTGGDSTGGDDEEDSGVGGNGIFSAGELEIAGGTITAKGGNGSYGGTGIEAEGDITFSGGTIESARGGDSTEDGDGGDGIHSIGNVEIVRGEITAIGGKSSGSMTNCGNGISGKNITVSDGKIKATGGGIGDGEDARGSGGNGIKSSSSGDITISGGTVIATGGNGYESSGHGISGGNDITVSGGNVTATGGASSYDYSTAGGNGITASNARFTGGTTTATGGRNTHPDGNGGAGISVTNIDEDGTIEVSGTASVTAIAGKGGSGDGKDGYALMKDGEAVDPASVVSGENARLETRDADGNTTYPVPAPAPDDDSDSDQQEPVIVTPAGVPGFEFISTLGNHINVHVEVEGTTMVFSTLHYGATLRTTLGQLRALKAQGITRITFKTLLHTTTLSIDTLLALGGDDAAVVLTHDGKTARLTVGGVVE